MTPALLDLFSGIGCFSLGLERAGFQTVAFCEIDPFCRRVLAKHWPEVPIHDDIRALDAAWLRDRGIDRIDAICGGFPCQDISLAGTGAGLDGERSGLWREYARLVGQLRPRYVIVENVGAFRARGLAEVLGYFAAIGYDAEWQSIPAAAVGAPHLRDRVWIVATDANADSVRELQPAGCEQIQRRRAHHSSEAQPAAANSGSERRQKSIGLQRRLARTLAAVVRPWQWPAEPAFRRVDDADSSGLDVHRLKALGNAVVPDIPEAIGRALLEVATV